MNSTQTNPPTLKLADQIALSALSRLRIGSGYDIHRYGTEMGIVILGGVSFESPNRLEGHSDADVLTHALMDAILGAIGDTDIGNIFPNTDPKYLGVSSIKLLSEIMPKVEGYSFINIDLTVVAEYPKISSKRSEIINSLAGILQIETSQIGLKATTSEGLMTGGVQAMATVLMYKN